MCGTPIAEGRNDMHPANDTFRVDEAECFRLALRVETNTGQTAHSPAGLDISIVCEPSHPEKVDASGCWILPFQANIPDIHVKHADNLSVPVGVGILDVLMREDHHIRMHPWVERVLRLPKVVCSIVDA